MVQPPSQSQSQSPPLPSARDPALPSRRSQFPTIDPWPDTVNGADLLEAVRQCIHAYVVLSDPAAIAVSLWIAHTYVFDIADFTPYLLVTSPVRECGKSTLLELSANLAHRALLTDGITAAGLYHRIERLAPSMLLDELDAHLGGESGENLRRVLDSGFKRGGCTTIFASDSHGDKDFATYCPKVLSGIGTLWDTVVSRSIPIRLDRASREELRRLTKIRGDRIGAACLPYQQRLLRWTSDIRDALMAWDGDVPWELGARQSDVWRALLAIADSAGGAWPEKARTAARALHSHHEETDHALLVLGDLQELFTTVGETALPTAVIIQALVSREDRPWAEYQGGRSITPRGLAALLGQFKVRPKSLRQGSDTAKGYSLESLYPAFVRYLAGGPLHPEKSGTSGTLPAHTSPLGRDGSVPDVPDNSGMGGGVGEGQKEAA